jgi:hypothetical protein
MKRLFSLNWPSRWLPFMADWRAHAISTELRRRCPRLLDAAAGIPPEVVDEWLRQTGAPTEVPGWQPSRTDWLLSSVALSQFFDLPRHRVTEGALALPSKAADSVWHVWLAHDAAGLARWQQHHFDRETAHLEAAELCQPLEEALAHSWAAACRSEGVSPLGRKLPLMFEVDARLRVPGGWAYGTHGARVFHQDIDAQGKRSGRIHPHAGLGAAALAGAGLLSTAELGQFERSQKQQDAGGAICGSAGGSGDGGCAGGSCGCGCGSS